MVDVFEIRGKVDLDIEPFTSKIISANEKLAELGKGVNLNFVDNDNFLGKMDILKDKISQVSVEAEKITTAFTKIEGINSLLEKITVLKNEVEQIRTGTSSLNNDVENTITQVQALNNEFSSMRYYIDLAKAETEGLLQLERERLSLIKQSKMDALTERQTLISEADERNRIQMMEMERQIQTEIIERLEREAQVRRNLRQETIKGYQMGLRYLEQQHEAETLLYDDIVKRYETQGRLAMTVQEQLGLLSERNAKDEQDLAFLEEQLILQKSINTLVAQGGAENIKQAEALMKQLESDTEVYAILQEQIALEREKLGILEEQDAIIKKQVADREKEVAMSSRGAKGNQLDKMGYLPSRIGSMAVTMWGFNEIMDIYNKSMQNMNAFGQQKAYTDLMKTDNRYLEQTNQNVSDVTSGITKMNKAINESYKGGMSLQKMYQKVDMQSVGANAMDSAFKYGVQADKLDELTEVMAIYGSEFVRQGRSQEDSILAVNDALDGEYRRLKEVNIGKEDLEAHGYQEGDTVSMVKALREIAQERGYDVVAQKITNLSDAITVLEIRIAQDLVGAFKVLEPVLTEVANDFIYMLDTFEWAFNGVRDVWNKFTTELDKKFGVQNMQKYGGGLLKLVGWAITLGITFGVVYKVVKALRGVLSSVFSIFGKGTDEIAKTTGDIAKTGGTVAKDSGGGFKENFKNQWSKLGNDLGKIARAFVDIAVIMGASFLLIEEGIVLISAIGYTYESLKPQFNQGIEFIKEFGLWFALLGGAMLVLSYALGKVPQSAMSQIGKGALNIAEGIAIAMGVVAVAIGSLLMPMIAIISLGALANWQQGNLDKGIEVIQMFGDALNHISAPVGVFLIALGVASVILGYAPVLGVGLAIGIAISIGLVAEAIFMLNAPLLAIASLGYVAQQLGQANIQQGAEALKVVGQALKTIADAVPSLLMVDLGVFGQELMDWGSQLLTGKDGLTYLSEDIIPNLATFVDSFNGSSIEQIDTTLVTNLSQVADQLPTIKTAIDKIRTSVGNGGTGGVNVLGFQIGGDTSALRPKLDALYEDIKAVIDFANKFGNGKDSTNATTGVTQMATAVAQLQAKINLMVTTITGASPKVKTASKSLGSAIKVGFNEGSNGFNTSVVSVLAKGISEVQSRYPTWRSGGEASAQKLAEGFAKISEKFKSSIAEEMGYALAELDNYKDDFYNKGVMLGQSLVDGFKSKDALDQNSPAKITKSIREELGYSMEALDTGRQMMYRGGVALGQALTNGYNTGGNLRTNVDVLASKGVNNQQLQANAKNVQVNAKKNQQVPQSFNPTINIDMSNSTVIGVQDLDEKIRSAVEKAIVKINSPNGAIGY